MTRLFLLLSLVLVFEIRANPLYTAVKSGDFLDPHTWSLRRMPAPDSDILIPKGIQVDVNSYVKQPINIVTVEGTLNFNPDANTALTVDSIYIEPTGAFYMGNHERSIHPSKTAIRFSSPSRSVIWTPDGK